MSQIGYIVDVNNEFCFRMTTTSAKDNQHCLVCNSRVGVSTRNSVQIFNKEVCKKCNDQILYVGIVIYGMWHIRYSTVAIWLNF